jgi:hypothetical protein
VLAQAERLQIDYLNSVRLSDIVEPGGQLLDITGPEPLPTNRKLKNS